MIVPKKKASKTHLLSASRGFLASYNLSYSSRASSYQNEVSEHRSGARH